jgi:hypothetical protein
VSLNAKSLTTERNLRFMCGVSITDWRYRQSHATYRLRDEFAYWKFAILKQSRLLNARTGESITFNDLGSQSLQVRGITVKAHRCALRSGKLAMDLSYSVGGN